MYNGQRGDGGEVVALLFCTVGKGSGPYGTEEDHVYVICYYAEVPHTSMIQMLKVANIMSYIKFSKRPPNVELNHCGLFEGLYI